MRFGNHCYKSAEHFYQAIKCVNESDTKRIRKAETSKEARILGQRVDCDPNWNERKIDVMRFILQLKFQKRKMLNKLLETDNAELIYLNYWHDTFWGVCTCTEHKRTGQNELGKQLMEIRSQNIDLKTEMDLVKEYNKQFNAKKNN